VVIPHAHPGEEGVQMGGNHLLQGNEPLAVGHDDKARQDRWHLHPRDAALAGLNNAEDAIDLEALKRLPPEPVLEPAVDAAMQSEWKRLTSAK